MCIYYLFYIYELMNCDTIVLYIYFVMFLCVYYERVLVVLYLNKDRKVTLGQK